jgi:hypothetical protein
MYGWRQACAAVGLLLLGTGVAAQTAVSGSIAGVVRDASGAVLPGATVEAASPALIERVRTVVTDTQGEYKIVDLRPGTYTVTFSLTGFATVKREGIILNAGFTAPVNAEMKVGSLEETVTVSAASPVVDVQNVRSQAVLTAEVLDAIPTGKTIQGFSAVILGANLGIASQDVGGDHGEQAVQFGAHGTSGADSRLYQDGMPLSTMEVNGGAGGRLGGPNQVGIQETVVQIGAMSAEMEVGGSQINLVPKDGSNSFKFYSMASYTNSNLQNDNLTAAIIATGLTQTPKEKLIYDYGLSLGGPIKQNALWFYSAHRWWGAQEYMPNIWYDVTPNSWIYTPDKTQPGYQIYRNRDNNVRLTWQASQKNKFTFSDNVQSNCNCNYPVSAVRATEATTDQDFSPINIAQMTWSHPSTNRLLFEGGFSSVLFEQTVVPAATANVSRDAIPMLELSTGLHYNAKMETFTLANEYSALSNGYKSYQVNGRFAVSYITGSHAFKVGFTMLDGLRHFTLQHNDGAIQLQLFHGVPASIMESASPNGNDQRVLNIGTYAQDQWTIKNLTLNLGIRFDSLKEWVPPVHLAAGPFVPARDFPEVDDVPNWKDVSPRLGASYDLFGNGKTAVKVSLGRYVALETSNTAIANSPSNEQVGLVTRTWTDPNPVVVNGYPVVTCNLQNPAANGDCGPISNNKFGTVVPTQTYANDVLHGYGVRGYNWQHSIALQHELKPGLGMNVSYYRTWFGNFTVIQNQAVTAGDFSPFCITVPVDPRLPGGGGNQICGYYDVNPAQFGQVNNVVTQSSNFGRQTQVFNGIDFGVNARFGKGGLLQGGLALGTTVTDSCYQNSNPSVGAATTTPRTEAFCHVAPSWWDSGGQIKFSGAYPLPWDFQASAVYQNLPGPAVAANYVVTNAQIAPSLWRNLAACGTRVPCTATLSLSIVPPNSVFLDRLNQLDLRFTKIVHVRRTRVQAMFDIYNVTNASTILSIVTSYPTNFLNPSSILGARLFKFGAQVDF